MEEFYQQQMIRELHAKSKSVSKEKRNDFIPFTNERDNLGRIIKRKVQKKNQYNILQMFQNLKKSTKQYFFDKEFEKMSKKFQNVKKGLQGTKDYDYDKQVQKCIQIANKLMTKKDEGQTNKQNLYINLRQKIDQKISGVTSGLKKLKCTNRSQEFSQSQFILKDIQREKEKKEINIELFKTLSPRSEMMATFCSSGLKYSSLVEKKKFNPWKTWYKNYEYELFPGKKVQVRCLEKSIYK